ncbi:helix-turn-helix domain-containing protein [Streptomyces sp. NPDC102270]|uniref:helix-turn-helix domain-containing protein n=1 Tax=Streptomyces sp. NPDC102270 TaxID=3366150 RepID=UPI0038027C49
MCSAGTIPVPHEGRSSSSNRRCSGPTPARLLAPLTSHDAPAAVLTPHPDDVPWLEQTSLQLLDEHRALGRRPLPAQHALRCSLLETLLLRLAHAPGADASGSSGSHPTYERFLDALDLNFRELLRVEDPAQVLGCSVRTLSRAARAAVGKGAREVTDERRLLEARRLLDHAQWTAHAIAAHLGFTDAANFGRFFRHHTGFTPAAYTTRQTARDT